MKRDQTANKIVKISVFNLYTLKSNEKNLSVKTDTFTTVVSCLICLHDIC